MKALPIFLALAVTLILGFANLAGKTPCHGVFLELKWQECLVLVWLPLAPLLLDRRETPRRWWVYFGLVSLLLMWPDLSRFIFTAYGYGRRMRAPAEYPALKLMGFVLYFALAPLVGRAIRGRA